MVCKKKVLAAEKAALEQVITQTPHDDSMVEYMDTNWDKSPYGLSKTWLEAIRLGLLMVNMMMLAACLATNEFLWFFYFYTFWGYGVSMFSVLASYKATLYKDPFWQSAAVFTTQWGMAMNLAITPLFWGVLSWFIFPNLKWTGLDLYMRIHMTTLHAVPFICTFTNSLISDFKPKVQDWKVIFGLGLAYMPFNALGTYAMGQPLYPFADWKNVPLTIFLYTLTAALGTYGYVHWCKWLNRS